MGGKHFSHHVFERNVGRLKDAQPIKSSSSELSQGEVKEWMDSVIKELRKQKDSILQNLNINWQNFLDRRCNYSGDQMEALELEFNSFDTSVDNEFENFAQESHFNPEKDEINSVFKEVGQRFYPTILKIFNYKMCFERKIEPIDIINAIQIGNFEMVLFVNLNKHLINLE
jgi:hypothetical protein